MWKSSAGSATVRIAHRVQITDGALESAVELSNRYVTDRCLPDKAIDVIDEAGARVRLRTMTRPPDMKEFDGEIERLNAEKDEPSPTRISRRPPSSATRRTSCAARMEAVTREWWEKAKEVDGKVDEEVVAEVVSKMTGVPLTRLESEEATRLLKMEGELHKGSSARTRRSTRSAGRCASAVRLKDRSGRPGRSSSPARPASARRCSPRRSRSSCSATRKPRADRHERVHGEAQRQPLDRRPRATSATKKAGSSPRRSAAGRTRSCCSTKIEKRTTTSSTCAGRSWRKAFDRQLRSQCRLPQHVIIMTTIPRRRDAAGESLGLHEQEQERRAELRQDEGTRDAEHREVLPAEFLGRVSDVVVFHGLTRRDLEGIVDLELSKVQKRLEERRLRLTLSDKARDFVMKKGYNRIPAPGRSAARSRTTRRALSEDLLKGTFKEGAIISVDLSEAGDDKPPQHLTFTQTGVIEAPKEEEAPPKPGGVVVGFKRMRHAADANSAAFSLLAVHGMFKPSGLTCHAPYSAKHSTAM